MKSNKGFTLPEVTFSLVILSVAVVIIGTMIITGMNIFARNAQLSKAQILCDAAYDYISERLTYGENITITEDISKHRDMYEGYHPFVIAVRQDGVISAGNSFCESEYFSVFSKELYGNMRLSISIEQSSESLLLTELTTEVTLDGDILYSRTSTVKMMNTGSDTEGFLNISEKHYSNRTEDMYIIYTNI